MIPTITAIRTRYAGRYFRSRLEARIAVFLDALNVEWEYEPQGYTVDDTPYLCDFALIDQLDPNKRYWAEVKGKDPTHSEWDKLVKLCQATRQDGYMFIGDPDPLTFRVAYVDVKEQTPVVTLGQPRLLRYINATEVIFEKGTSFFTLPTFPAEGYIDPFRMALSATFEHQPTTRRS